jgi:hypothetical protein
MCFELMVTLSVLLHKTLVIPSDQYSRITEPMAQLGGTNERRRPPNPQDLFDLDKLGRAVDMVIGRGWPPIACLARRTPHNLDIDPLREVICFPKAPPRTSARFKMLRSFLAGRRSIVELTEELRHVKWLHAREALGHFYTSFFLHKRRDSSIKRLFRDHFSFHPMIIKAAAPLVAKLGSYSAIHVRRGDFLVDRPRGIIPAATVARNISARIPPQSRLYVATNEMNRAFFEPLAKRYDLRFFSDIADDRDYLPCVTACAEMLICASARVFVGNRFSTFSGYITRLRGYRRATDAGIYFTDGHPAEPTGLGKGSRFPFSWQESVAAGTPLWGREYREGWEFEIEY